MELMTENNSDLEEPTEDWTIEQLLQWCLQNSQSAVNSKTGELIQALQELQDNAERDIWELHHMAVKQNMDHDNENETGHDGGVDANAENISPNLNSQQSNESQGKNSNSKRTKQTSSTTTSKEKKQGNKNKNKNRNLFISIQSGPHEGATFLLKPRQSRPCEIGRSKGKKFLQRGVSLFKDSEVSTCHGKFEVKAGKIYYTDTGSTNGTSYNGEAIEDNVPLELVDGMVLVFGESELEFTIVDN